MSSDWHEITFGEFVAIQRGHDLPDQDRKPGSVPILGSFGITGYHDTIRAKAPGVTIGRSGASFGVAVYTDHDYWPLNTALYVTDFKGNHPKFVFYFMKAFDFSGFNSGSAQPSLNRNNLYPVTICIPSPVKQKGIADLLGCLDDRIILLRETNATLEAIAQALFKSWFVDFDPVRAKAAGLEPEGMDAATAALFPDSFEESELGLVPRGWMVRSLDSIANYLNGLAMQKFPPTDDGWLPVIKIAQLRKGNTVGADRAGRNIKTEYIIQNGDVLFSWSGSLEVVIWCGGEGALNQHLFKVTSKDFPKWFYYLWTRQHLTDFQQTAASKATTMGHIQRKHLTAAKVVVPPTEMLRSAGVLIEPLLERWLVNAEKAQTLTQLRDTLLPRLISGQLRLPEAEEMVEEVCA
ncbi:type I restriction endonuclease subunit S (plasmid) [Pseudomonas fragi]|uniref:restriction endonuclease subunit S n=1 Tax=Pseudomonas fragi TaxID=296 RepID=UPI000A2A1D09|nr:restriction endonuclease subunit S [Pseudomonas fragi]ARQ77136.1 type I restriction endonuclease subunit S [Pseudomonas fragi]